MLPFLLLGLCLTVSADTFTPVGGSCQSSNDCSSNNCRFDGSAYTCGAVHVGSVCRFADDCTSNTCNLPSGTGVGVCILGPIGRTCAGNTDCSSGNCGFSSVCARNTNDPYDNTDPCHVNDDCTSGVCGGTHCAAASVVLPWTGNADQCSVPLDCNTFLCAATPGPFKTCQQSGYTRPCAVDADCKSGVCDLTSGPLNGQCTTAPVGAACTDGSDCTTQNCVASICRRNSAGLTCSSNADCLSSICLLDQFLCANDVGTGCTYQVSATANPQCVTQQCSAASSGTDGVCLLATASDGLTPCYHDSDCITFNCSTSWANTPGDFVEAGVCLPSGVGTRCEVNGDCTSMNCINFACAPNVAGSANTDCQFNSDCTSRVCDCSSDPNACHAVGNYGTCTAVSPLSPCGGDGDCAATGSTCDATSNLCTSLANGATCSDASWCASNYCPFGGQTSVCTACTSGDQCGSFVCNNGVCAKSTEGGFCFGNSDCTTRLCLSSQCVVSSVGGYCESEIDCTSLQCGPDGTCKANSFGSPCRIDSDCVTGECSACDVTGSCLSDPGTCQATTAGRVCAINADCTSGVCQNGICQVSYYLGHCGADSDCPAYLFCSPPTSSSICNGDDTVQSIDFPHCDLNACYSNNGFCDDKATCTPLKCHRRQCSCNAGYFGRGNAVSADLSPFGGNNNGLPIDERPGCSSPCVPGLCDANADCVAVSMLITSCRCQDGFLGPGYPGQCYVNPCTTTNNQLGPPGGCELDNQVCVLDLSTTVENPNGVPYQGWNCVCAPGFYVDNFSEGGECIRKPTTACGPTQTGRFDTCQCGSNNFAGAYATSNCAPNNAGGVCLEDSDCTTLNCVLTDLTSRPISRTCQVSQVNGPCAQDSDCTSQNCDTETTLTCQPNEYLGGCVTNNDCREGLWCFTPFAADVPAGSSTAPRCVLNKCASTNGGCDADGWCTPLGDDIHICSCPPNSFGTGYRFNPDYEGTGCRNPCERDNGGCWIDLTMIGFTQTANRATCQPTSYKSVVCTCPVGMVGDGVGQWGCQDDVCGGITLPHQQVGTSGAAIKLFYGCPVNSHCITVTVKNSQDGYLSCKCELDGYVYSEPTSTSTSLLGTCVPSPCRVANGGCGDNAVCTVDLWARAVCTCRSGYTPQGTTFAPGSTTCSSNPCGTVGVDGKPDNGGCDAHAICLTRAQIIARGGKTPELGVQRVCVCNAPYMGDGFHCLEDPCRALPNYCQSYANTVCTGVYIPPSGTGGPEVGVGPQLQPTCPCLPGYVQSNAFDNSGWAACTPGCSVNNGNCDAATTSCQSDGSNRLSCRCKAGFGTLNSQGAVTNLGGVVPAGTACVAVRCEIPVTANLPANSNAGTCASSSITAGQTCNLACDPSFTLVTGGDVLSLVSCVAVGTAAPAFVLPSSTTNLCVSASQVPTVKPVKSPRGSGWSCQSTDGVVSCAPANPTLRKSWSEATHTGSLTVSWKALGTSVPVTRVDVVLSGAPADLVGVVQTPANPQLNPSKAGSTVFTLLHPGRHYTVSVVATVRTSAAGVTPEETVQYTTQSFDVIACSATC